MSRLRAAQLRTGTTRAHPSSGHLATSKVELFGTGQRSPPVCQTQVHYLLPLKDRKPAKGKAAVRPKLETLHRKDSKVLPP